MILFQILVTQKSTCRNITMALPLVHDGERLKDISKSDSSRSFIASDAGLHGLIKTRYIYDVAKCMPLKCH